jgi:hypothetical protein
MTDGEHSDVGMHSLIERQRDAVNRTGTFCDQEAGPPVGALVELSKPSA